MPTTTTNLALIKPDAAEVNWTSQMNGNLDAIDNHISTLQTAPLGTTNIVPFSLTPNFDLSQKSTQVINLTGNVGSSTVSGARDGCVYHFLIKQDATGGRGFAWPANFKGAVAVSTANGNANASGFCSQTWSYVAADAAFYPRGPMISI